MNNNNSKGVQGRIIDVDGIKFQIIDGKLFRYADLTLDKGFKIVLGRIGSERILMDLLNCLLGLKITHLEYRNNEHPGMTEEDRSSRFDIYCRDENGGGFLIEMQNWGQKYFNKRAVYYSSLAVQNQAVEEYRRQREVLQRDWDYDFKPLYVVSFLNFRNWTYEGCEMRRNKFLATYRYMDVETGNELGDGTTLVFVDLERFTKPVEECVGEEDLWMYCIKNMGRQMECPEVVTGTKIEELYRQAELSGMTMEQRISYETSFMSRNDMLNSVREQLETAREEAKRLGLAEGRAEGKAEGRAEGLAEAIRKMMAAGFTVEQVCEIMQTTSEEVFAANGTK